MSQKKLGLWVRLLTIGRVIPDIDRRAFAKWLLVGYLMRILVMPLFVHTDLLSYAWWAIVLKQTHQLVPSVDTPVIFVTLAAVLTLFDSIIPKNILLPDFSAGHGFTPDYLFLQWSTSQHGINLFVFILKLPYLVFDFATAITIPRLIEDRGKALLAFKLWMLNPILLYITYMWGQYDLISVFFVVIALYYLKKNSLSIAAFCLGLGAVVKIYPLLFLPLLLIIQLQRSHNLIGKLKAILPTAVLGLLPLLLLRGIYALIPVFHESANGAAPPFLFNGFLGGQLFLQGQPTSSVLLQGLFLFTTIYSPSITVASALPALLRPPSIYTFYLIYALFLIWASAQRSWSFERIWQSMLVLFLAFYSIMFFNPPWFLWVQPMLLLLTANNSRKFFKGYIATLILFFTYLWYWDGSLLSALIAPVFPQAYSWGGPITLMKAVGIPGFEVVNILRTILSAVCIYLLISITNLGRNPMANAT